MRFTTVSAARASLIVAVTVTSVAPPYSAMVSGTTLRAMDSGLPMVTTASLTTAPGAVPDRMTDSFGSSSSSSGTVKVSVNVALDSPGAMRKAGLKFQIV